MKNGNGNGLREAVFAAASGVLTELICHSLFETKYSIEIDKNGITLTPVENYSVQGKVLLIFLLFFFIWLCLSFLLPRIQKALLSLCRVKRPVYSKQEIIKTYYTAKNDFAAISQSINSGVTSPEIYWEDLMRCINSLYVVFCKNFSKKKASIKNAFNFTDRLIPQGYYSI